MLSEEQGQSRQVLINPKGKRMGGSIPKIKGGKGPLSKSVGQLVQCAISTLAKILQPVEIAHAAPLSSTFNTVWTNLVLGNLHLVFPKVENMVFKGVISKDCLDYIKACIKGTGLEDLF